MLGALESTAVLLCRSLGLLHADPEMLDHSLEAVTARFAAIVQTDASIHHEDNFALQ